MQPALIQGFIAKNNNKIPAKILNCDLINSGGALITLTLNIIRGILKTITITLPIAKFLLFKRFIEPEIEAMDDKIGELRKKVTRIKYIFSFGTSKRKQAKGIIIKKGS